MSSLSSQRLVLLFTSLCLVLILVSSFLYRSANPTLTVRPQVSMGAAPGPMAEIGKLMSRLEQNPDDIEALKSIALLFMEAHDWDRAAVFLNRVLGKDPENLSARYHLGVVHFQREDYPAAERAFLDVLELDSTSHLAHYNLGVLYRYFLEKPEQALPHFQKVIEIAPEDQHLAELVRRELEADHGPQ
jgi:tetratricopeptide (TPR) repeat protein